MNLASFSSTSCGSLLTSWPVINAAGAALPVKATIIKVICRFLVFFLPASRFFDLPESRHRSLTALS